MARAIYEIAYVFSSIQHCINKNEEFSPQTVLACILHFDGSADFYIGCEKGW